MQENITHNAAEVRIENLSKRFGELYAVKDVNLHIQKGDFYTFLGPSGCGKTTLLRMVAGFTTPDEGDIYFDEQRINDIPPWERNVGKALVNEVNRKPLASVSLANTPRNDTFQTGS